MLGPELQAAGLVGQIVDEQGAAGAPGGPVHRNVVRPDVGIYRSTQYNNPRFIRHLLSLLGYEPYL